MFHAINNNMKMTNRIHNIDADVFDASQRYQNHQTWSTLDTSLNKVQDIRQQTRLLLELADLAYAAFGLLLALDTSVRLIKLLLGLGLRLGLMPLLDSLEFASLGLLLGFRKRGARRAGSSDTCGVI